MKKLDKIILYADGASLGNPGKAGIGVVIYNQDKNIIKEVNESIGFTTNNVAEYMALIYALEEALYLGAREVSCFLDSELLVKQLKGSYRVKDGKLKLLHQQIKHLENFFEKVNFNHIGRDGNKEADKLAKEAAKRKREQGDCGIL